MGLTAAQRAEFRQMVAPTLRQGVEELARVSDPAEREIESADLLPDALLEDDGEFLSEALELIADVRGGLDVLAGMAVAAPTPVAIRARTLLEELEAPPAGLGRLTVEQAWEMIAGDDPVRALFLLCSREGANGRQLFSFTIETLVSGGAVKDAWATGLGEGAAMAKRLTGKLPEEEVEARAIEPDEGRARILAAAEQGARTGLAPTEEGLQALTTWLRASGYEDADALVQALEFGEVSLQELDDEAMSGAIDDLTIEAETWALARGGGQDDADSVRFTTGLMGDFLGNYLQLGLSDWREEELEEFLLDWVPRKVSLAAGDVPGFTGVVAEVLAFLADSGRLDAGVAAALAESARGHQDAFVAAMADPTLRGPAKAVFDAMTADGVELGDEAAMQAWIDDLNSLSIEERERILGPRVLPVPEVPMTRAGKERSKARKAQKQARKKNRKK